ncbi:hypothetical protein [Plantactinospora veratri]
MSRLRWPAGLRVRLLLAFVSLGLTTTAVVAGASYVQARNVILQQAQDAAVVTLKEQITRLPRSEPCHRARPTSTPSPPNSPAATTPRSPRTRGAAPHPTRSPPYSRRSCAGRWVVVGSSGSGRPRTATRTW